MSLVNKIMESDTISREDYEKMFKVSKKARKKDYTLTVFFNNSSMSKILDLFLDNPDLAIFTPDFMEKADVSRKSLYNHIRMLMSFDIIIEIEIGKKKFYKWNTDNQQAKHISKLRDILNNDNVSSK